MGYDVSFHPISPEEMREWYFTPLTWIQQGQEEKVLALAAQYGIEDFYAEKYLDTLRVGAETESNELFDKSHGFYIAVIQGFFRDYYYTRGSFPGLLLHQRQCLFFPGGRKAGIWAVLHLVGSSDSCFLSKPHAEPNHRKLLLRCISVSRSSYAVSQRHGAGPQSA